MIMGRAPMPRPGHATAKILVLVACLQYVVVTGSFAAGADNRALEAGWPTKAWPVSSPEQQGMQSGVLARLVETVGGYKQDSLLIVPQGNHVLESFYAADPPNLPPHGRSVAK